MPTIQLPFSTENKADQHQGDPFNCTLYRMLPQPFQEVARKDVHLMQYLHMVPVQETGIPEYVPKLSRGMREAGRRNVIYPVGDRLYVHVFPDQSDTRDWYVPVEPVLTENVDPLLPEVEKRLLDHVEKLAGADTPEARQRTLLATIDQICEVKTKIKANEKRGKGKKVKVTPTELEALRYILVRDKIGMGALEPLIRDPYIEDISCSGTGPIFIEHKIFKALKSSIVFETIEDLDGFVLRLSERIKKPVTFRRPITDATLPDGSRINVVYGGDVSKRGSNFTIRKFAETPLSILELINLGSLDYHIAAYLSIMIEEGMNLFVSGETASGKTTLLNALTTFIPPSAKIVSIEDTPELQVPHPNWVREVVRGTGQGGENMAGVSMFDLLKAALRQRPNEILVGEIRGEEGAIAFQAMQTGHAVMSTFHAATVEKLIQRITGDPINIPKAYVDNLNVVVIQSAVHLPDGRVVRRVMSVNEIVGYDPPSDSFSYIEIFRWDPATDTFEFVGNKNSYLLENRVAVKRGIPSHKRRVIYDELERRATVLQKLQQAGVTNFHDLFKVLAKAHRDGLF